MGYTTKFSGELKFANHITPEQRLRLDDILGKDARDHPEWHAGNLTYIDLQLTIDHHGLEHNHSEKSYDLHEQINLVIDLMKKDFPEFELTGKLLAQGEEAGDVWYIVMENNKAIVQEIDI